MKVQSNQMSSLFVTYCVCILYVCLVMGQFHVFLVIFWCCAAVLVSPFWSHYSTLRVSDVSTLSPVNHDLFQISNQPVPPYKYSPLYLFERGSQMLC